MMTSKTAEGGAEHQPNPAELVAQFEQGKTFYYRDGRGSLWEKVGGLEDLSKNGRSMLGVNTPSMDKESLRMVSREAFLRLQQAAQEEGAEEFLQKFEARRVANEALRADADNPSLEGIKRIFAVRYRPLVAEKILENLGRVEGLEYLPDDYRNAYGDFESWAAGSNLEAAQHHYPSWGPEHFATMLKQFDDAEALIRAEIEAQLKARGVDLQETEALLARAAAAKRNMEVAIRRVRSEYGLKPEDKGGY